MNQPAESTDRVCRCGFPRDHHRVTVEPEYTFAAWALLLIGISAAPKRLLYRCRRCQDVIDVTTDPATLKAHY